MTQELWRRECGAELGRPTESETPPRPDNLPPRDLNAAPPAVPGCLLQGGSDGVKLGGMGAVYFGTDTALGRPVAVKVLREHLADDPVMVARFEAEARICAQLQHPGIVPVYQVGRLADGRPFYVMKLVRGDTLADLLRRRASPTEDLIGFLSYFRRVCEAMAYAHAHRVLHRDLKPANVMVGSFGEVLLMDWGLAKVLGEPEMPDRTPEPPSRQIKARAADSEHTPTEVGSVLGTFAYMPPEQAAGRVAEVDTRSDVFGLGAILFTILTGQPPYGGPHEMIVLRQAAQGDLASAEARLTACGADAELVALARTCLAPRREDRSADAAAVARAMTAYLAGVDERLRQAELERKAAEVRAVEERKRRRVWVGLAAAVALLVAVVAGGSWWMSRARAEHERRLALAREGTEELFRQAATALEAGQEVEAGRTLGLIGQRLRELPAEDLRQRLEAAEKDLGMLRTLNLLFERRWQVEQTVVVARVVRQKAEPEEVAVSAPVSRAPDLRTVGADYATTFAGYGISLGEGAMAEAAARVEQSPIRPALIDGLGQWFLVARDSPSLLALLDAVDPDETRRAARRRLAAGDRRGRWAVEDGNWTRLAKESPSTVLHLADLLADEQAIELLQRAVEHRPDEYRLLGVLIHRLLLCEPPRAKDAVGYARVARALRPRSTLIGILLMSALSEERAYDEAVRHGLLHLEDEPNPSVRLLAQLALGNVLLAKGDNEAARRAYLKALDLDPRLAYAAYSLGLVHSRKLEHDEAIRWFRRAADLDPTDAEACNALGWAYSEKGQYDTAIGWLQKAIALNPKHAAAQNNRGWLHHNRRQFDDAVTWYKKAIASNPRYVTAHINLGDLHHEHGRYDEAIQWYKKVIEIEPRNVYSLTSLGGVFNDKREHDQAIAWLKKAIDINPNYFYAHNNLGVAYEGKGEHAEAIRWYKRATELAPNDALAHRNLGGVYRVKGEHAEAIRWYRKAADLDAKDPWTHAGLGRVYLDKQEYPEAIKAFEAALALAPGTAEIHGLQLFALGAARRVRDAVAAAEKAQKAVARENWPTVRYNAACAFALAGCGTADAAPLDSAERTRLRRQALAWLADELTDCKEQARKPEAEARTAVAERLRALLDDEDFRGVRDPKALDDLPAAERQQWAAFWNATRQLLDDVMKPQPDRAG